MTLILLNPPTRSEPHQPDYKSRFHVAVTVAAVGWTLLLFSYACLLSNLDQVKP